MEIKPVNTFLSVVLVVDSERFAGQLRHDLPKIHDYVQRSFKDFEFIMFNFENHGKCEKFKKLYFGLDRCKTVQKRCRRARKAFFAF